MTIRIMKTIYTRKHKGAVSILTVIIVSAIVLLATITTLMLNIDLGDVNLRSRQRLAAKNIAESCFEESMAKIKDNLSFSGNFTLNINDGSCQSVISTSIPGQSEVAVTAIYMDASYILMANINTTIYPVEVSYR